MRMPGTSAFLQRLRICRNGASGELLPHCDEIVIARGDLGNAMPLAKLPCAQEEIADQCRKHGRAFMVVTQMLASMEHRAVPTRAEVSDIFRAVQQGAASVMLTGETAAENIRWRRWRFWWIRCGKRSGIWKNADKEA